jgi:hypothetical protein
MEVPPLFPDLAGKQLIPPVGVELLLSIVLLDNWLNVVPMDLE